MAEDIKQDEHGLNIPTENRWVNVTDVASAMEGSSILNKQKIIVAANQIGEVDRPNFYRVIADKHGATIGHEVTQEFVAQLVHKGLLNPKKDLGVDRSDMENPMPFTTRMLVNAGLADNLPKR